MGLRKIIFAWPGRPILGLVRGPGQFPFHVARSSSLITIPGDGFEKYVVFRTADRS